MSPEQSDHFYDNEMDNNGIAPSLTSAGDQTGAVDLQMTQNMMRDLQNAITSVKAKEEELQQVQTQAQTNKNSKHKSKVCRFFKAGDCHRGDACGYIHENASSVPPSAAPSVAVSAPLASPFPPAPVQAPTKKESMPRFRPKVCDYFRGQGYCPYGEKCKYPHVANSGENNAQMGGGGAYGERAMPVGGGVYHENNNMAFNGSAYLEPALGAYADAPNPVSTGTYPENPASAMYPETPFCRLYPAGMCQNGDSCIFRHDGLPGTVPPAHFPVIPPNFYYDLTQQQYSVQQQFDPSQAKYAPQQHFDPAQQQYAPQQQYDPAQHHYDPTNPQHRTTTPTGPAAQARRHPLYKTRICQYWQTQGGKCSNGADCNFLHPDSGTADGARFAEMQTLKGKSHPLYKSKTCRFWKEGHCGRGKDCWFKHE